MSAESAAGSDDLERRVNELEARMDAMSNWVEALEDELAAERAAEERAAEEPTEDEERGARPSKHPEDYN